MGATFIKKTVRIGTEPEDFTGQAISLKVRKSRKSKTHFTRELQKVREVGTNKNKGE